MRKWKNDSGQILVLTALIMTVLLGFVAFATDVGLMLRQRRMAQTAADSAALAAATELAYEGNPSNVTSGIWDAATHDAMLNGFTPGAWNGAANPTTGVTLSLNISPSISVPAFNSASYAQATVSLNTETVFMRAFGIRSMNVGATAIASYEISSDGCIYVLNPNGAADPAVSMGGSSLITSPNCAMYANGDVQFDSAAAAINAKFVSATGSISGKSAGNGWAPNSPPQDDPLDYLQDPAKQPQPPSGQNSCTAPAGSGMGCVYDQNCSSTVCTLTGTLQPGMVYYFDKPVSITGSLSGTNDTIYLASPTAYLYFSGNGTMSLTPPGTDCSSGNSNPLCGIVVDAPTAGSGVSQYVCSPGNPASNPVPGQIFFDSGSGQATLAGVLYAPYMQLFAKDQASKKSGGVNLNADLVIGNYCAQAGNMTVNGYGGPASPLTRVGLVY